MSKRIAGYWLVGLWMPLLLFIASCGSTKNAYYFNMPKDVDLTNYTLPEEPLIQKSDILTISITSRSTEASLIFNTGAAASGGAAVTGYLVNAEGNVQLPILGAFRALGLTRNQLKADITNALLEKKLLVDPLVNISFANARIIMLGEVSRAGILPFTGERLSIIEAIGQAGDLPVTANKSRVLLIREENGRKMFRYLDLTSSQIFTSPYFYLKSNDIIYVEPTIAKVRSTTEPRIPTWVTFVMTSFSFVVGIAAFLK